jgi:hypothetical protein
MRTSRLVALALILWGGSAFGAQNPQTTKLKGKVADTTGAVLTATDVKVFQGTRVAKQGQTDNNGEFSFDLPPGDYQVEVSAPDFNTFKQNVRLAADTPPLAVTLSVAVVKTTVDVKDDPNAIEVSLDQTLGNTTLADSQIEDLPDNEDDLAQYLQSLAGARGGVEQTATFIIDGFSGGRLPPREQIAQIIIENNPFGAETGGDGPRIRIITKPGTGEWRGQMGFQFNDSALNAQAANAINKPSRQTRTFNPEFSGPLIPGKVTMNFQGQSREQSQGNSIVAITPTNSFASDVVSPSTTRQVNPRFVILLNDANQLNLNFGYSKTLSTNQGIGQFNLPERAYNSERRQFYLQASESATIGKLNNELRFQFSRSTSSQNPLTSSVSVNVTDAFNGGSANNQSTTRTKSFQLADQVRAVLGKNGKYQINAGVEADYNLDYNSSQSNYFGTYTFASLYDYCYATNFAGVNCQPAQTIVNNALALGITPTYTDSLGRQIPITGRPTQFTLTSGNALINVNQFEFSTFFESVIRVTPKLAAQVGLRYQVQAHLKDYNNLGPRLALNYQIGPKTVIRGGGGIIFAQTGFSLSNWEQLLRNNGTTQLQTILYSPVYNPTDPLSGGDALISSLANTIRTRAGDFVAPYNVRGQFGLDQKISNTLGLNVTYDYSRGDHILRTRNTNAPFQDCVNLLPINASTQQLAACRPDPTRGNVYQYDSTAKSLSHNLSFQFRQNLRTHGFNFQYQASYTLGFSKDDGGVTGGNGGGFGQNGNGNYNGGGGNYNGGGNNGGGGGGNYNGGGGNNNYYNGGNNTVSQISAAGLPSNNYNLAADWGRSNNDQRHRIQAVMQVTTPAFFRGPMQFNLQQINWNSGRPYNVTTGTDDNADGVINDRPLGLGRNTGFGPKNYNLNLRIGKTFMLHPQQQQPNASNPADPQRGNNGFGGGNGRNDFGAGNGGGGNGNYGNFGGNRNGGNQNFTGPRMSINLQIQNMLNHPQESIQSSVLTSPFFGRLTGSNPRTITLNLNFQF